MEALGVLLYASSALTGWVTSRTDSMIPCKVSSDFHGRCGNHLDKPQLSVRLVVYLHFCDGLACCSYFRGIGLCATFWVTLWGSQ